MTSTIDKRGYIANNSIEPSETNKGSYGKLTSEQIKERARFHARRFAYGKPTIQDIVDHWYTAYGIKMGYSSEKEWAWRNESLIVDTMNEMIDANEIPLRINESSFVNTLKQTGVESAKMVSALEDEMRVVLKKCDFNFDPMKKIGVTLDQYDTLDEKSKAEVGRKVRIEEKQNELRIKILSQLSKMVVENKQVLISAVVKAKELFDDTLMKDRKLRLEVEKQVGEIVSNNKNLEKFDPTDVEVTDSMRGIKVGAKDP